MRSTRVSRNIYFDEIRWFHRILIWWKVFRGYRIHIFTFDPGSRQYSFIKKLEKAGHIEYIFVPACCSATQDAIKFCDSFYERFYGIKTLQIFRQFYGSEEADLVARRELAVTVNRFFFMYRYFSSLEVLETTSESRVECVSYFYIYFSRTVRRCNPELRQLNSVRFPVFLNMWDMFSYVAKAWCFILASLIYPLYAFLPLLIGRCLGKAAAAPQQFDFAIQVQIDLKINPPSDRDHSLILDQRRIRSDNTVFLLMLKPSKYTHEYYHSQGYHYLSIPELRHWRKTIFTSYGFPLLRPLILLLMSRLRFWWIGPLESRVLLLLAREYISWNLVLATISFKSIIGSNRESIGQVAANILLKKRKILSWDYATYIGGGSLLGKQRDLHHFLAIDYSYLNFSRLLCFNDNSIYYHKLHSQHVGSYTAIGSVYSQQIAESNYSRKDFVEAFFTVPFIDSLRIVTFFDTTFVDFPEAYTNFEDGIAFYRDILRYVNSHPHILVVIKPSKSQRWFLPSGSVWSSPQKGRKILDLWEELNRNKRVLWARKDDQSSKLDFRLNNRIMSASDVVVTHAMSSPTAEALGASKKSFFYESHPKHFDSAFSDIPGLLVQGYEALERRIDELLNSVSKNEYREYLESNITPRVVPNLEANAICLLRDLLVEETFSEAKNS